MKIDHIGFVVKKIESAIERFTNVYGFAVQREAIYDTSQHVMLAMLVSPNSYRVELIQPVDKESPSYDFMEKGGGLHHFCYCVSDIESSIIGMKRKGHLLIKRPVEAPLLDNRRVAFLFSKNDKQIIEIVESREE